MAKTDADKTIEQIMKRKEDHINICLEKPVETRHRKTLFEDVHLINNALPEIDFDEIDTSTKFLGHKFDAPLMVGAISGGAALAKKINKNIAEACQELGLGMVVGSQRAGLIDNVLKDTYSVVRESAPDIFIGSNIGGVEVSKGLALKDAKLLIEMLDADAFYIHLNPAQEIVQPEGEPIVQEPALGDKEHDKAGRKAGGGEGGRVRNIGGGCGQARGRGCQRDRGSREQGAPADSAIEKYRAEELGMEMKMKMGELLWDWGIPTAAALYW